MFNIFSYFILSLQTCSQLIKAGIKLHIQNKRKHSGCDSSGNESSIQNVSKSAKMTTTSAANETTSLGSPATRVCSAASLAAEAALNRIDTDSYMTSEDDACSTSTRSPRAGVSVHTAVVKFLLLFSSLSRFFGDFFHVWSCLFMEVKLLSWVGSHSLSIFRVCKEPSS